MSSCPSSSCGVIMWPLGWSCDLRDDHVTICNDHMNVKQHHISMVDMGAESSSLLRGCFEDNNDLQVMQYIETSVLSIIRKEVIIIFYSSIILVVSWEMENPEIFSIIHGNYNMIILNQEYSFSTLLGNHGMNSTTIYWNSEYIPKIYHTIWPKHLLIPFDYLLMTRISLIVLESLYVLIQLYYLLYVVFRGNVAIFFLKALPFSYICTLPLERINSISCCGIFPTKMSLNQSGIIRPWETSPVCAEISWK